MMIKLSMGAFFFSVTLQYHERGQITRHHKCVFQSLNHSLILGWHQKQLNELWVDLGRDAYLINAAYFSLKCMRWSNKRATGGPPGVKKQSLIQRYDTPNILIGWKIPKLNCFYMWISHSNSNFGLLDIRVFDKSLDALLTLLLQHCFFF